MATIKQNKLTGKQSFELYKLIGDKYIDLKKSDSDFARYATEELKFVVLESNVQNARTQLGIDATATVKAAIKPTLDAALERIEALEKRLDEYEAKNRDLIEKLVQMTLGDSMARAFGSGGIDLLVVERNKSRPAGH